MGLGLEQASGVWGPREQGSNRVQSGARTGECWPREEPLRMDPWVPPMAPHCWAHPSLILAELGKREEAGRSWAGKGAGLGCTESLQWAKDGILALNQRSGYSWGNPWSHSFVCMVFMVPGKPVLVVWGGRGLVILKLQYWPQLSQWLAMRRIRHWKNFWFWNNFKHTESCKDRTGRFLIPLCSLVTF